MVHVLNEVLRKMHRSLRSEGVLLITQPTLEDPTIVELEIAGKVERREEFLEPNFRKYLSFTREAIQNALDEQLFVIEQEAVTPNQGFHQNVYQSLDEWKESYIATCEDLDELNELSTKLRKAARGKQHRIVEKWKETGLLLRKAQPEPPNR